MKIKYFAGLRRRDVVPSQFDSVYTLNPHQRLFSFYTSASRWTLPGCSSAPPISFYSLTAIQSRTFPSCTERIPVLYAMQGGFLFSVRMKHGPMASLHCRSFTVMTVPSRAEGGIRLCKHPDILRDPPGVHFRPHAEDTDSKASLLPIRQAERIPAIHLHGEE